MTTSDAAYAVPKAVAFSGIATFRALRQAHAEFRVLENQKNFFETRARLAGSRVHVESLSRTRVFHFLKPEAAHPTNIKGSHFYGRYLIGDFDEAGKIKNFIPYEAVEGKPSLSNNKNYILSLADKNIKNIKRVVVSAKPERYAEILSKYNLAKLHSEGISRVSEGSTLQIKEFSIKNKIRFDRPEDAQKYADKIFQNTKKIHARYLSTLARDIAPFNAKIDAQPVYKIFASPRSYTAVRKLFRSAPYIGFALGVGAITPDMARLYNSLKHDNYSVTIEKSRHIFGTAGKIALAALGSELGARQGRRYGLTGVLIGSFVGGYVAPQAAQWIVGRNLSS